MAKAPRFWYACRHPKNQEARKMKFNILIVDDEYYICEGLRTMLENFQIQEIGEIRTCYSGEEALTICQTFKPQIILTDIKMSKINGIELIKQLNRFLYPVRFLVLSGYDDYDYVRSAFQNGAVDYLLKPVISTQLEKLIRKQCQFLQENVVSDNELYSREKAITLSRRLFSIITQPEYAFASSSQTEEIQRYLPYCSYAFYIIACSEEKNDLIHEIINQIYDYCNSNAIDTFLCSDFSKNKIAFLLNCPQEAPDFSSLWKIILDSSAETAALAIGISRVGSLSSLYSLYYETENRLSLRLLDGYGKIYHSDLPPLSKKQPGKIKQITSNLLQSPELLNTGNLWEQLCTQLHRLNITDLKHFYTYFTGLLCSHMADYDHSEQMEHIPTFYDFSSYGELEQFLNRQLQIYASYYPKELKNRSNIENIKEYIDNNFTNSITLKEVADLYFISTSHLSKLFHEKYNMSFQEYLAYRRMTYAENLLHDPLLSIQEIADMTGYDNAFNFSRAFKNYFGISPSHYRKQNS